MSSNAPSFERIGYIDTHTGGEPTRVVFQGGPDLGDGDLASRCRLFRDRFEEYRSAIVNVEHVERLDPRGHGDVALTLADGREVTLSRRYRDRFEQVLESLP